MTGEQLELVDVRGRTLEELAVIANEHHALAWDARDRAIGHALTCGAALLEAQTRVRRGGWLPWLDEHFQGSTRTAQVYMQVSSNAQRSAQIEPATIQQALRALGSGNGMDVHYSTASPDWETPGELYAVIDAEFGFDLDVCATDETAKADVYYTSDDDGLAQEWDGVCWMNPPYGTAIGDWMAKAHAAGDAGAVVVCLVPARTDTAWWWDHARHGEIRFLRGRLKFSNGGSAPFPSALVIFGRPPRVVWWDAWTP